MHIGPTLPEEGKEKPRAWQKEHGNGVPKLWLFSFLLFWNIQPWHVTRLSFDFPISIRTRLSQRSDSKKLFSKLASHQELVNKNLEV